MQQKGRLVNMKNKDFNEMDYDVPEELDLSKAVRSPYPKLLKQQVTINLSKEVIEYFKKQSSETGIPYQSLINLYLLSCVNEKKKLDLSWK